MLCINFRSRDFPWRRTVQARRREEANPEGKRFTGDLIKVKFGFRALTITPQFINAWWLDAMNETPPLICVRKVLEG